MRLLPVLMLLAAGCQLGVGVTPCRHGESCPDGQTCSRALGVCADPAAPADPADPAGPPAPRAGDPPPGQTGEGEGEGQAAGGEGEGEGQAAPPPPPPPRVLSVCGNGTRDAGEQCDDGGRISGDGCSSTCRTDTNLQETEPNDYPVDPGMLSFNAQPLVVRGAIELDYDSVANAYYSGYDALWLTAPTAQVVRIEAFDTAAADDCFNTQNFVLALYRNDVATAHEGAFLRDAAYNGVGNCAALTVALDATQYLVLTSEMTGTQAIPSYRLQVAPLTNRGVEHEPNGDVANAELAVVDGLDVSIAGTVAAADDVDVYAVDLPPGRGVRAEAIPTIAGFTCDGFNAQVALLDDAGVQLVGRGSAYGACAFVDGTGVTPRDAAAANRTFAAKTVYVVVSKGGSGFAGALPYDLAVTVR